MALTWGQGPAEWFGPPTAFPQLSFGHRLDLRGVFKEGQLLGSSLTDAQPASVAIMAGGSAELTLEPEFAAKLASLFVAVNPILPAEHLGTPFTLPITGGQIATDASSGTLETSGGLEAIQQDGGQLTLANLWPDLGGAGDPPGDE
jgi:hypothetical protein